MPNRSSSSVAVVSVRSPVGVSVHAVLGVRAQELLDRVDVPPDDDLHGVTRRSACGYGPPS